jgi:methyl-accepting chemotaxis protein
MYRRYFKAKTLKDFYLTMNDTHARLTKEFPGIHPPRFTYEDKGDTLLMTYHSKRGYPHYFEGILNGAAEFFKERVKITVTRVNDETYRAEIMFQGGAARPKALA